VVRPWSSSSSVAVFGFPSQLDETLAAAEMGGKCPHRKVKKRRLSHKTARRGKFLLKADDAVYDELVKLADEGKDAQPKELPVDEDLPGMGQFYCLHCEYALSIYPYGWSSRVDCFDEESIYVAAANFALLIHRMSLEFL
jgi:hypothetical protein